VGQREDGSTFPIGLSIGETKEDGRTIFVGLIHDLTARKRSEMELLTKVDELERMNVELGHFAHIAAHDLQEPLRMVSSYNQLLSKRYKGKLDHEADEFIAFAVGGALRMKSVIEDLLKYSRIETTIAELPIVASDDAAADALRKLKAAIEESGAVVTRDPLPEVHADYAQLVELFRQLIENAIKFRRGTAPKIHLAAARDGRRWTFSVSDNGLGIEAQYFGRIFEMFQRLHKREEFSGTGIGLAICKKIVARHGGVISVASEPKKGSTFSFSLEAA
jgi:light-regulated signal transduction histidine kinase (bacteriophytochrome)